MPRSFVLANDLLYAAWDSRGVLRELCTGGIGGPNHLNGNPVRFGLFAEGKMRWLEDWSWVSEASFMPKSTAGMCVWSDSEWEILAEFHIHPNQPVIRIHITVTNRSSQKKDVRLFVHEDLSIGEFDIGDTAMFQPQSQSILHWKEDVCVAFTWADKGPDGFACGITRFGDAEGVWRDADDGDLSGNPIAQGSVDSIQYRSLSLESGESKSLELLISVHKTVFEPISSIPNLVGQSIEPGREESRTTYECLRKAAVDRLPLLPSKYLDFAARSLQVVLAHCDPGGAIMAANDSFILTTNRAHYRYCWMRDGAEISSVLASFKFFEIELRFFDFCMNALQPNIPFFLQKYGASGALGATWHPWIGSDGSAIIPLQADETARVVRSASEAFLAGRLRAEHMERLVLPCAQFLARFADPDTGLCLPSYDLWEERWGVHSATAAETIIALSAASKACAKLGLDTELFELSAAKILAAYRSELLDNDGIPARMRHPDGFIDRAPDSSCLLPFVLSPDETFGNRTNAWARLESTLRLRTTVGGWARYDGDYYFRRYEDLPGNAWVITTLWAARTAPDPQIAIEAAIDWCIERSRGGTLAEQYDPRTGEALSVSPLAWSHSEVLAAMVVLNDMIAAQKAPDSSK